MEALIASNLALWVLVCLNLVLTLALIRRMRQQDTPKIGMAALEPGSEAPSFEAEDLMGVRLTRESFQGSSLLLVFLSTRCEGCLERLEEFHQVWKKATALGTRMALVVLDERDKVEALVREHEIKMPVLIAPRMTNGFASEYKITTTPAYVSLDENHRIAISSTLDESWDMLVASWSHNSESPIGPVVLEEPLTTI